MPRSFPVLCCAMLGPSHAMPCYAVSCSNEPHCTILCLPGLFHAMLCHVKLCSVLPCHTVPCHVPPSPNANSPLQAVLPTMVPVPSAPCCPLDGVPLSLSLGTGWGARGEHTLQPAGPQRAPTQRIAVALTPSPTADSGNRWQEEALGHHQLLLSLADDTECKFCWHYSLRLFCLYIPPVLITVIEL